MEAQILDRNQINPYQWDEFVAESAQGNIYQLYHYLCHLLPDWKAVIATEGDKIVAAMPFQISRKFGIEYALQPYFSQYMGILFAPKSGNTYRELEFEKKAIQLIHSALPASVRYLSYNFAPEFRYDLALIWLGWTQKPLYTYWTDISKGYTAFMAEAAPHVRREVKKAIAGGITITVENSPDTVLDILKTAKPESVHGFSSHFFDALSANARHYFPEGKSCCLIAYHEGKAIAGIIYFFYKHKMIYYQGSSLPSHKNSGAMTLIITESVRLFGDKYTVLDFDGSMIEPIERFLRGFGAYPIRYTQFTLNRLPIYLRWLK